MISLAPGTIIFVPKANIARHPKVNNILLRKSLLEGLNKVSKAISTKNLINVS